MGAAWVVRGSNYLFNHALPRMVLKTKDDLYHAWAIANQDGQKICKKHMVP